jgi:hypothetical protein
LTDDQGTLLLKTYEIPVVQVENLASKFQKLCVFSGLNTGAEEYFEMSKAVDRTEKAVHRVEKDVGELKKDFGELKGMLSAILAHLNALQPSPPTLPLRLAKRKEFRSPVRAA